MRRLWSQSWLRIGKYVLLPFEFLIYSELTGPLLQLEGAPERPIIFICHSLGGIIVKRVCCINLP